MRLRYLLGTENCGDPMGHGGEADWQIGALGRWLTGPDVVFSNCHGKRPYIAWLGHLAVAFANTPPGTSGFGGHRGDSFYGQMEGKHLSRKCQKI
jgi:hypothetical protein